MKKNWGEADSASGGAYRGGWVCLRRFPATGPGFPAVCSRIASGAGIIYPLCIVSTYKGPHTMVTDVSHTCRQKRHGYPVNVRKYFTLPLWGKCLTLSPPLLSPRVSSPLRVLCRSFAAPLSLLFHLFHILTVSALLIALLWLPCLLRFCFRVVIRLYFPFLTFGTFLFCCSYC